MSKILQGLDEAFNRYNRRDAYQRDYDNSVAGMGKRQSQAYRADGGANDEGWDEPQRDYTPKPVARKGMYFYNVPTGQEDKANEAGLFRTKSGKWYSPFQNTRADMFFGKGRYWEPKTNESQLDELSNDTLASYKKKAGADASAADKKGDYERGNKRFKGIVKATKKEFDNDAKQLKEFAPDDDGDSGEEDVLRKFAKLWYNGDDTTQQQIEKLLARSGWEIGELESEEGGAFVVQAGDENGDTYIGFTADDLVDDLDENCWKGYHKEGNKELFGKTVPNCVKNEDVAEGTDKSLLKQVKPYCRNAWVSNGRLWVECDPLQVKKIAGLLNTKPLSGSVSGEYAFDLPQGVAEGPEFDKWADERVASQLHKLKPATYLVSVMDPVTGEHWRIEANVTSPEMAKERAEAMGYKVLRVKEKEGVAEDTETYKQGHAKYHTKTNKQIGPTHYGRGSDKKADSYTKADPRYHEVRPVKEQGMAEEQHSCPHCGGELVSEELMNEKKDACYYKVKSRYKVWPSAYASGALVKCRKKGASNWGNSTKNESSILEGIEQVDENLRDWFKEKWVRFGPDGKIRGDCARGDDSEGKPKCLPQSKAHSLGKKGRASAAARKRREDPNPERSGKAINVNTKKKSNEGVTEETIHVGHRNSKGDWIKTSTHNNYTDAKAAMKELEKAGKKGVQHRYDNKGNIDPGAMMTARPDSGVAEEQLDEKWSQKYKDSINCSNPKGFSQRAHCQGKKK